MPGYIKKKLQCHKHALPSKPQNCPFSPQPKQYGSKAQRPIEPDTSSPLSEEEKKQVQRVVGSILYYDRAVDLTVLILVGNSVLRFRFLGLPEFGIPLPSSEFRNFPAENQIGKPENRSSRKSEFRFPFSGIPEFRL